MADPGPGVSGVKYRTCGGFEQESRRQARTCHWKPDEAEVEVGDWRPVDRRGVSLLLHVFISGGTDRTSTATEVLTAPRSSQANSTEPLESRPNWVDN